MDTKLIMRLWGAIMLGYSEVSWCTKHNMIWRDCTCNYPSGVNTTKSIAQLLEIVMEMVQNE